MKRLVSIILVVLLISTTSIAFAADYSSMTDEQLKAEYDAIRNELVLRGFKAENKTVIVEQNDVQIYINGDITLAKRYAWDTTYSLFVPVVFVNNTNKTLSMIVEESSVNGWTTEGDVYDVGTVPAGKKAKGNFIFALEDTDVETLSDFTDVEFTLRVYDDNTWDDLFKTKAITIYPVI